MARSARGTGRWPGGSPTGGSPWPPRRPRRSAGSSWTSRTGHRGRAGTWRGSTYRSLSTPTSQTTRTGAYRSVEGAAKGALVWERGMLKERTGLDVPEELSVQRIDVTDKQVMKRMGEFIARIPAWPRGGGHRQRDRRRVHLQDRELLGAGATSVTICNLGQDQEKVYEAYAKKIFPYLRENHGSDRSGHAPYRPSRTDSSTEIRRPHAGGTEQNGVRARLW